MKNKKLVAIQLRKKGRSYQQISQELDVAKSTLSFWLKDLVISEKVRNIIKKRCREISIEALIKRNKKQTVLADLKARAIRKQFSQQIGRLSNKELLLVGSALYWGEGYKKGAEGSKWKCVDFANTDPFMIKIMMDFFRKICGVKNESFKIQLMLHDKKFTEEAIKFWEKTTGINRKQFIKVSFIKSIASKKKQKNILKYGTVHVRVYSVDLFHRIIGYIDGLKTGCSSVG